MERISRELLEQPTLQIARALLGCRLLRRFARKPGDLGLAGGRIVEVEAYIGEEDTACHASSGRTERNAVLYGPPGLAYVYFTYGMHWMLNVVTEREGFPAAILIRAIEPEIGIEAIRRRRAGRKDLELTSGPARLAQALGIDRKLNGTNLLASDDLFLSPGEEISDADVIRTPRIGIDYAERGDRMAAWRFLVRSSRHTTGTRRSRAYNRTS